ncbi:MAG: formate hydrogenlyase [bacterium]
MNNSLSVLSLSEQLMLVLAALVLLASFSLLLQQRLVAVIHTFAWQGALVSAVTALAAFAAYEPHLYFSALMTLVIKAMLIPYMLHRQVRKLGLVRHVGATRPAFVLIIASALVVFSYYIVLPIEQLPGFESSRNIIAITLAVVLLGLLVMVVRHNAVGQVVGFMSMENGLFFAAVATTNGMPMVVELGVAFDVLVAAVLFGVFFFQIHGSVGSFDVDMMNKLSETEDPR